MVALDGDVGASGGVGTDTRGERYATGRPVSGHPERPIESDSIESDTTESDSTDSMPDDPERRVLRLTTVQLVVVAAVAVTGVWSVNPFVVLPVVAVVGVCSRSWLICLVAALIGVGGAHRSAQGWASLAPGGIGPFTGWARMIDDPQRFAVSTRVILEIDGERFEVWSRGRARQLRVAESRGGSWIAVSGDRTALDARKGATDGPRPGSVSTWAMLIKRVYEVDPLECPCCGGQMKFVSFIEDCQGDVMYTTATVSTGAASIETIRPHS